MHKPGIDSHFSRPKILKAFSFPKRILQDLRARCLNLFDDEPREKRIFFIPKEPFPKFKVIRVEGEKVYLSYNHTANDTVVFRETYLSTLSQEGISRTQLAEEFVTDRQRNRLI